MSVLKLVGIAAMLLFLFLPSAISAQTITELDQFLESAGTTESQEILQLTEEENATIFIFDNEIEVEGEGPVRIANVAASALNQLYTSRDEFEKVKLIKIKIKNKTDLQARLILDDLTHFQNLKYIYIVASFDICPENPGDTDCQKSKISNIVSVAEGQRNVKVLYHIIALM